MKHGFEHPGRLLGALAIKAGGMVEIPAEEIDAAVDLMQQTGQIVYIHGKDATGATEVRLEHIRTVIVELLPVMEAARRSRESTELAQLAARAERRRSDA